MTKGKFLGHIMSENGIRIYLERVQEIQKILLPHTKKEFQEFLGNINFLRRFIPYFVEIVQNIAHMLKSGMI